MVQMGLKLKHTIFLSLFSLPLSLRATESQPMKTCFAELATMSNVISSEKLSDNAKWAGRFGRYGGGRGAIPQHINEAEDLVARFKELLLEKDKGGAAAYLVKSIIDNVEKAYRVIKDIHQPARKKLQALQAKLGLKNDEFLSTDEANEMVGLFIHVTKNFLKAKEYSNTHAKAVDQLSKLELRLKTHDPATFSRKEVLSSLKLFESWINSSEVEMARVIGYNYTNYSEVKSYLEAAKEDNGAAFQSALATTEHLHAMTLESAPSARGLNAAPRVTPAAKAQNPEEIFQENLQKVFERVGWKESRRELFSDPDNAYDNPLKANAPTIDEVRLYFSGSNVAGVEHTARMRNLEFWEMLRNQGKYLLPTELTLATFKSIIVPFASRVTSLDGWKQMLYSARHVLLFFFTRRVLTDVQKMVASNESIDSKTQTIAAHMAKNELVGQYFLDMLARYYTLKSKPVWNDIVTRANESDFPYPSLVKSINLANHRSKIALPVSSDAANYVPARIVGYSAQFAMLALYFLLNDEEDRKKIAELIQEIFTDDEDEEKSSLPLPEVPPPPPTQ